jgi:hypothetical protein
MSTERFNFNAKPGEPGFREITKNQYGHTVLQAKPDAAITDDKVNFTIDPETGMPRADISIWDSQQMKDLAKKYNMPLDEDEDEPEKELPEETQVSSVGITDKDMDDLLLNIEDDLQQSTQRVLTASNASHSTSNTELAVLDNRVRKVAKNSSESEDIYSAGTKLCADSECNVTLPYNAKFCSSCGRLQKINLFCIECGRKFHDREKFCSDCGCARQ